MVQVTGRHCLSLLLGTERKAECRDQTGGKGGPLGLELHAVVSAAVPLTLSLSLSFTLCPAACVTHITLGDLKTQEPLHLPRAVWSER